MLGTWEAQARHFRLEFQGWSSWCRANPAERSAEAPASTDAANPKLQGQSLALTPVASSGWFGDVFISSKSSGQLSPNCNREPHELHEKKSASSARTPRPPNPTGGNVENRGSSLSPFSPLPPVQNARAAPSCRTFNIQHSTSNIQHPTSNIQHSTFNTQRSTFNIQHLTWNLEPRTLNGDCGRKPATAREPSALHDRDYCPWPSAPVPSRSIKMSRGSAPLLGPTMPRFSSSSMMRAARV